MLTHIVCWKYKAEITAKQRAGHLARLRALAEFVPDIISLEVGTDVLHLDRSFDTGLVAVFKGREELDAYTVHTYHQTVAAYGRELAEKAVSVDFFNGE